jgi:hypothetical protein
MEVILKIPLSLSLYSMGFWCGDLREGDHLGDPGVDERIVLK